MNLGTAGRMAESHVIRDGQSFIFGVHLLGMVAAESESQ